MEEARYLLTKLIGMTLNHAALAAQREASNKELQSQVTVTLTMSLASINILQVARNHQTRNCTVRAARTPLQKEKKKRKKKKKNPLVNWLKKIHQMLHINPLACSPGNSLNDP